MTGTLAMEPEALPFVDLAAQQRRIGRAVEIGIAEVIRHGQYIMGPEVAALETALASFSGTDHVITCANGTDALQLALMALGIGRGDAVFVPAFTFVATAEAVCLVGATPVFVDVRPDTFNMCTESLAAAVAAVVAKGDLKPVAVIPVDLFGQPADYRQISHVASRAGMTVIADAAQSFGAEFAGRRVGALAAITTTSFFPAKPLGCFGDGGAVLTNDAQLAERLRSLRNHGQGQDKYDNVQVGLNSRLDTIQAAVLLAKLTIFEDELRCRSSVAQRYGAALEGHVGVPVVDETAMSAWAQYTITHSERDTLRAALKASGIPTAVYYPRPIHLQGPYRAAPCAPDGLPNAERLPTQVLSLPIHPYLAPTVQDRIIDDVIRVTRAC